MTFGAFKLKLVTSSVQTIGGIYRDANPQVSIQLRFTTLYVITRPDGGYSGVTSSATTQEWCLPASREYRIRHIRCLDVGMMFARHIECPDVRRDLSRCLYYENLQVSIQLSSANAPRNHSTRRRVTVRVTSSVPTAGGIYRDVASLNKK